MCVSKDMRVTEREEEAVDLSVMVMGLLIIGTAGLGILFFRRKEA